jgi:hypothetical protein
VIKSVGHNLGHPLLTLNAGGDIAARLSLPIGRPTHLLTQLSANPKTALEDDFENCDDEKDAAHDGVQAEKGGLDPVEAAAPGDPMLKNQAADNNAPADNIGERETAKQAKNQ